jgi:hypothetical protein
VLYLEENRIGVKIESSADEAGTGAPGNDTMPIRFCSKRHGIGTRNGPRGRS